MENHVELVEEVGGHQYPLGSPVPLHALLQCRLTWFDSSYDHLELEPPYIWHLTCFSLAGKNSYGFPLMLSTLTLFLWWTSSNPLANIVSYRGCPPDFDERNTHVGIPTHFPPLASQSTLSFPTAKRIAPKPP
jgi:hypothetical protein